MDSNAVDADLSRKVMRIVIWTIGKCYGKNSMCWDLRVVCLLYLKISLFFMFPSLMSKHYVVPKETEGLNFWLNCCVFRATDIPLSYLASGEGGNCAASPCFQFLRYPRWWESIVKERKEEMWAKVGNVILKSQASTYQTFWHLASLDQQVGI